MACLAVSGESEEDPGAFLTGANCEALGTSISDTCCAIGNVSKMNSSSFTPCMCRCCSLDGAAKPSMCRFCLLDGAAKLASSALQLTGMSNL